MPAAMDTAALQTAIEAAYEHRQQLSSATVDDSTREAILKDAIAALDSGQLP